MVWTESTTVKIAAIVFGFAAVCLIGGLLAGASISELREVIGIIIGAVLAAILRQFSPSQTVQKK
ncbi:MAG: hypothetical protein Q8Q12_00465 [bacterium]|nr:hypothetical protein [bacterium]